MTALGFLVVTGLTLRAGETTATPTGTWKVSYIRDGKAETYQPTLKLKSEDGKLTGTLTRNTGSKIESLPVADGKLKGSEITFTVRFFSQVLNKNGVPQPPDTNYMSHWKFQGAISGDIIKGSVEKESPSAGRRTQDWEAKRLKE